MVKGKPKLTTRTQAKKLKDVKAGKRTIAKQRKQQEPKQSDSFSDDDPIEQPGPDQNIGGIVTKIRATFKKMNKRQKDLFASLGEKVQDMQMELTETKQTVNRLMELVANFVSSQASTIKGTLSADSSSASFQQSVYCKLIAELTNLHLLDEFETEKIKVQIDRSFRRQQLENIELYCHDSEFWKYYQMFGYLEFAAYMMMLRMKQSQPRTMENNINSFRKISTLFKEKDIVALDMNTLNGTAAWMAERYSVNEVVTINLYLRHFTALVRRVHEISMFTSRITMKHYPADNVIVSRADFMMIMEKYSNSGIETVQLMGFCLYLMFATAQRNETVRTVEFAQFRIQNDKYTVALFASKTQLVQTYEIDEDAYNFVQIIKAGREKWAALAEKKLESKQKGPNRNDAYAARRRRLIERRLTYLFTFFSQSALHYQVGKIKQEFTGKVAGITKFLIHNIRKLKIRAAYEEGGIKKAQEVAQHAKKSTTTKYYLGLKPTLTPWRFKKLATYGEDDEKQNAAEEKEDDDDDEEDQIISTKTSKVTKKSKITMRLHDQDLPTLEPLEDEGGEDNDDDDDDEDDDDDDNISVVQGKHHKNVRSIASAGRKKEEAKSEDEEEKEEAKSEDDEEEEVDIEKQITSINTYLRRRKQKKN